jgi:hypothetical protein
MKILFDRNTAAVEQKNVTASRAGREFFPLQAGRSLYLFRGSVPKKVKFILLSVVVCVRL